MDLTCRIEQNFGIVSINGRLDAVTADEFQKKCMLYIEQGNIHLIIDMADLDYISSAGLRSLLTIAKKMKTCAGTLCLCGLNGLIEDVINLSGFSNLIPIYSDVKQAVMECEQNG